MALGDEDKFQEVVLLITDAVAGLNKKLLYILLGIVIAAVPLFFILRPIWFNLIFSGYIPPEIVYQLEVKQPLQVIDKKIFKLADNTYSGYVRVRNINLDWGVPVQPYLAEFKTFGGTLVTKVEASTFVPPAGDKVIVFSRFTADKQPDEINFLLAESKFNRKPISPQVILNIQRSQFSSVGGELRLSSTVNNTTAFGVKKIGLPAVLYNNKNEVVGVNYTVVNDVRSGETRSFEYFWPTYFSVIRVEILPEVDIFDRNLLITEEGKSIFDEVRKNDGMGY